MESGIGGGSAEHPLLERYTGGGWEHIPADPDETGGPLVDAHIHIFPPLGSTNRQRQADAWRYHLRDSSAFWRKDTGRRVTEPLLAVEDSSMPKASNINFKFTDNGQAEFTIDDAEYIAQVYPPSTAGQEARPDRMVAEMDQVGVDIGVLQSDHVYGDVVPYYEEAMRKHPGRFVGLAQEARGTAGGAGRYRATGLFGTLLQRGDIDYGGEHADHRRSILQRSLGSGGCAQGTRLLVFGRSDESEERTA